jgi:hypothetical protein
MTFQRTDKFSVALAGELKSVDGVQLRFLCDLGGDPFTDESKRRGGAVGLWQWELVPGGIFGAERNFKEKATFDSKLAALRSTGNGDHGTTRKTHLTKAIAGNYEYDGFFWTESDKPPGPQ